MNTTPLEPAGAALALRRRKGRRTLALIAGLLALPFVVATLLWHFGWQPARQANHGELLVRSDQMALTLHEADLQKIPPNATLGTTSAPSGTSAAPMLGHWLLALAVPAECTAECLEQLDLARRVQVSLNKEMKRLQRGLIGPQLNEAAALAAIRARWPDLMIARPAAPAWSALLSPDGAPHLFLIDPQGRLVLRYPAPPDAKGVRRDLERLLKYSWLG